MIELSTSAIATIDEIAREILKDRTKKRIILGQMRDRDSVEILSNSVGGKYPPIPSPTLTTTFSEKFFDEGDFLFVLMSAGNIPPYLSQICRVAYDLGKVALIYSEQAMVGHLNQYNYSIRFPSNGFKDHIRATGELFKTKLLQ